MDSRREMPNAAPDERLRGVSTAIMNMRYHPVYARREQIISSIISHGRALKHAVVVFSVVLA